MLYVHEYDEISIIRRTRRTHKLICVCVLACTDRAQERTRTRAHAPWDEGSAHWRRIHDLHLACELRAHAAAMMHTAAAAAASTTTAAYKLCSSLCQQFIPIECVNALLHRKCVYVFFFSLVLLSFFSYNRMVMIRTERVDWWSWWRALRVCRPTPRKNTNRTHIISNKNAHRALFVLWRWWGLTLSHAKNLRKFRWPPQTKYRFFLRVFVLVLLYILLIHFVPCVVCAFLRTRWKEGGSRLTDVHNTVRQVLKGNHRHYCSVLSPAAWLTHCICRVIEVAVDLVGEALRLLFRTINVAKDFENIAPFSLYVFLSVRNISVCLETSEKKCRLSDDNLWFFLYSIFRTDLILLLIYVYIVCSFGCVCMSALAFALAACVAANATNTHIQMQ